MLVLTPKEGEIVEIGPDVRIHVRKVSGRAVRLAIEAPKSMRIQRISAPDPSAAGAAALGGEAPDER